MSSFILTQWNFIIVVGLMMIGFYTVVARGNLLKKMIGLAIFQTSVFIFYISAGKISGGTAPILTGNPDTVYSNPLPHVLILTAIVVGVATTAVGYALIIRIYESFGTIEEDELTEAMNADALTEHEDHISETNR
ncbi:cation:proton antiporter subunit C [Alphaproteobacteria bacterium]|jgi:multicomponent Na+:H+ antiporter subunit C|nr:cation:proton antiporter subunit C [Alphaproteobacteria bacterium]